MRDSHDIAKQASKTLAASSNDIPTAAGAKASEPTAAHKEAVADAIDQMFAEFELVFHNQYNKAFATPDKLMYAKKLWYSHLAEFTPRQILAAARRAVRESDYLPTVHGIRKYCEDDQSLGLPDAWQAYREACQAGEPKAAQPWSHPAVYHAGKASDWFFLANHTESAAFPVFKRNYELLCERVRRGERLEEPVPPALPASSEQPLSTEEQKRHLAQLRKELGL